MTQPLNIIENQKESRHFGGRIETIEIGIVLEIINGFRILKTSIDVFLNKLAYISIEILNLCIIKLATNSLTEIFTTYLHFQD